MTTRSPQETYTVKIVKKVCQYRNRCKPANSHELKTVTVAGLTCFSTNKPTPVVSGSCTANLGEAKVYAAPLFCKAAESKVLLGGGLPPSHIAGDVFVTCISPGATEPVTQKVPFVISAPNPKDSTIEPKKVTLTQPLNRKRKNLFVEGAR